MHRKLAILLILLLITASLTVNTGFASRSLQRIALSSAPGASASDECYPFDDVKGHWAEPAIMEMYAKGVMKGYNDQTFRPNKPVSYLEAVVLTDKMLYGSPLDTDPSDAYLHDQFGIPNWAVGYIASAMENGLMPWSDLTKAAEQQPITRQSGAVLAVQAMKLTKQAKQKEDAVLPFTDVAQVEPMIKGSIAVAAERKIMNGFTDNTFQPSGPISRAEMAIILSNIAGQLPYINSEDASGFVKSVDLLGGTITLTTADLQEVRYSLPEKYLLYLNNRRSVLSELSAGNHVRIISADPTEVTVLIGQVIMPDNGTPGTTELVNIANSPDSIKSWVDTNKATENYVAMIYENNLYFLASRGEKMTGGYTVDITRVTVTADDKEVHYRVWTERTDPSRDAIVNQVISYPTSLVRMEVPQKAVGTITFVDELNRVIAETKL